MNGVSIEPEEALAEINHDFYRPLSVVIFGADSGLKAKTYKGFRRQLLGGPLSFDRHGLSPTYHGKVKTFFHEGRPVLVCMSGDDSMRHGARHKLVKQLRALGSRTIVGVYVEVDRSDKIDFSAIDNSGLTHPAYYRQIDKFRQDPPTADGLNFYLVINSDNPEE